MTRCHLSFDDSSLKALHDKDQYPEHMMVLYGVMQCQESLA